MLQYDVQVKNRLKRIEGQIRGILTMMEGGSDCRDVVTQLSATRSAIDRCIGIIVSENLIHCVQKEDVHTNKKEALVKEAVQLLVKSR